MFNIPDHILFDKSIIKVIDGIAGSGKSSTIDRTFSGYGRYTSTNLLCRDSERRYSHFEECKTIASGLFNTVGGCFYADFREPKYPITVIDEILQTNTKVFDWVVKYKGITNIFITTDSKQTLAPECEVEMLERYNEFIRRPDVYVEHLSRSFRAKTQKTEDIYQQAYKSVGADANFFDAYPYKVYADSIDYDPANVYICHTKELERMLYAHFDLYDRYDLPLIPKGTIASKPPKNVKLYPILPQLDAEKSPGYWQIANIATPTRYQGSEITGVGYFVIEERSVINNREFYTVLTRFYDIDDLKIVVLRTHQTAKLETYNNKPIKRYAYGVLNTDESLTFDQAQALAQVPDGTVKRRDAIILNGKLTPRYERIKTTKRTMNSLLKREGVFTYPYMEEVYKVLDAKTDIEAIRPVLLQSYGHKDEYRYQLDLKAAYPHILNYATLPTSARFELQHMPGSFMEWFTPQGNTGLIRPDCLVTGDFAKFFHKHAGENFTYLFSTSCKQGSKMGEWLHNQAHLWTGSSQAIKDIHYGFAERQYIEPVDYDDLGHVSAYVRDPDNNHQLLMCAIRSELARIMTALRLAIYGDVTHGCIIVDALYFNYDGDIGKLANFLKQLIHPYDFRIYDGTTNIFQTYPDLPTKRPHH